jgi:hypothetical protein
MSEKRDHASLIVLLLLLLLLPLLPLRPSPR